MTNDDSSGNGDIVPVPTTVTRDGKTFVQRIYKKQRTDGGNGQHLPPPNSGFHQHGEGRSEFYTDRDGRTRRTSDGMEVDDEGNPIYESEEIEDDHPRTHRSEEQPETIYVDENGMYGDERVAYVDGEERFERRDSERYPDTDKAYKNRMDRVKRSVGQHRRPYNRLLAQQFKTENRYNERSIALYRKSKSAQSAIEKMSPRKQEEYRSLIAKTEHTRPGYLRRAQRNYITAEFMAANTRKPTKEQEAACVDLATDYHLYTGAPTSWHSEKEKADVNQFHYEVMRNKWSRRLMKFRRGTRTVQRSLKREADDWSDIISSPFRSLSRAWTGSNFQSYEERRKYLKRRKQEMYREQKWRRQDAADRQAARVERTYPRGGGSRFGKM